MSIAARRAAAAAPQDQIHRGGGGLPGRRRDLQHLPVKAPCTTSDHGRIVHRSFYEAYLDKVRGYHATEAYQKAMRKRQVWVEPLFAEAKEWHGLRRLRLRGLAERQHPGTADRGRAEPEALPGRERVGPAPRPLWQPPGPPRAATQPLYRLRVMTDPAGERSTGEMLLECLALASLAIGGFFQRAGALSEPVSKLL